MGNNSVKIPRLFKKPTNIEGVEAGRNVDKQAQANEDIYKLVKPPNDAYGQHRGILVEATARAFNEKNFAKLHELIKKELDGFLYDGGAGKLIPRSVLVERRHIEREKKIPKTDQDENADFHANIEECGERLCCWDIDKRGAVGETVLHLCFLNDSRAHNLLAKHLIELYPNLLHDIYHSEEYYGESVIHMAMANEDYEMLELIVKKGKEVGLDLQERCFGNFFCPDDQKPTRRDDPNSEVVAVDSHTNYKGHTYWGELPLSFASCLSMPDAVKLLVDHGADLYASDTNGNNVLHMMVIQNNKDMFNLAYRLAKEHPSQGQNLLEHRNRLGFTPLTLAAKLANKELFDHILELKSSTMWAYGDVICKEYPLSDLDSIDHRDGSINTLSALNIVLEEESTDHLDMLDGLLYQLLHDKWKSYAKIRFYRRSLGFILYMAFLVTAAYLHPGNPVTITSPALGYFNSSCYIPVFDKAADYARTIIECIVLICAGIFLYFAVTEIRFQGIRLFFQTLYNAPTKGGFLISCILIICVLPCRMSCAIGGEDILISLSVCTCIPYCLFFCRGFKLVGPFIVMIYKMIAGDLLRFLIIYVIFLLGFSQAMFVLFRDTNPKHEFFSNQFESIMAMFMMTLGEFKDNYDTFDTCRNPSAPKLLFLVYMVIASILLLNMFIAMMGNTFNRIAETQKEWQRQWAKIVLVIEQTVSPLKRKSKQRRYSQPYGADGSARSLVIRARVQTIRDKDEATLRQYVSRFQNGLDAISVYSNEIDAKA